MLKPYKSLFSEMAVHYSIDTENDTTDIYNNQDEIEVLAETLEDCIDKQLIVSSVDREPNPKISFNIELQPRYYDRFTLNNLNQIYMIINEDPDTLHKLITNVENRYKSAGWKNINLQLVNSYKNGEVFIKVDAQFYH